MGPSEVASSPGRLGPWRPMDAKQREKHQGSREDMCPLAAEKNMGKLRENSGTPPDFFMDIQGKSKEHMRKSERKPSVLMIFQKNLEENHQILPANITFAACSRKTI
jgi:hypothetical protein